MFRYKFLLPVFFLLMAGISSTFSQNELIFPDARSMAVAGAGITFTDHWACFHNQAALAFAKSPSMGIHAENRYDIRELNSGALAIALPVNKYGAVGLSYYIFNNSSIYNRQKFSLAYSKLIGKPISIGIQFDLLFSHVENYENNLSFCGEIGLLYRISPKWEMGVHIFNPTAASFQKYERERIPTIMKIGAAWHITDNTLIITEVDNSSQDDFIIRTGLEHEISKKIAFQIGLKSNPWVNSFGLSYSTRNLRINIAMEFHQMLGVSPGVSFDKYFIAE